MYYRLRCRLSLTLHKIFSVPAQYSETFGKSLDIALDDYKKYNQKIYNDRDLLIEQKMAFFEKNGWDVNENKNKYYNESLTDLVRSIDVKNRLLEHEGKLLQQIDPVFQNPAPANILDYRTGFFFPNKQFMGLTIDTYIFNLIVIWLISFALYWLLYGEVLRKVIAQLSNIKSFKSKK